MTEERTQGAVQTGSVGMKGTLRIKVIRHHPSFRQRVIDHIDAFLRRIQE